MIISLEVGVIIDTSGSLRFGKLGQCLAEFNIFLPESQNMTVYATAALLMLVMCAIWLFAAWMFRLCSDREIKRPEYQNRNSLEGMRLRASSEAYLRG